MTNRVMCLRVLADVLEEKAKGEERSAFNMKDYFSLDRHNVPEDFEEATVTIDTPDKRNVCGSALCIAGFSLLEAGWTFKLRKSVRWSEPFIDTSYFDPQNNEVPGEPNWNRRGAEILDLPQWQANIVFLGTFDDGKQSISILEKLAFDQPITNDEWEGYARAADLEGDDIAGAPFSLVDDDGPCRCSSCRDDY